MNIDNATVATSTLKFGVTPVGMTAVRLTEVESGKVLEIKSLRGVLVRAPGSTAESDAGQPVNTNPIWIGGEGVTPSTGLAIPPGNAIVIPVDEPSKLWIISTANSQRVAWIAL